ncbi:MAG: transglutaminaseTgpA domain-containing protein [Halovenus sp.]
MNSAVGSRESWFPARFDRPSLPRVVALLAALGVLSAFLSVPSTIVDTVGNPASLSIVALVSFVAATLLSRVLRVRTALAVASLLLVVGLGLYLLSLPYNPAILAVVRSNVGLLTGQTLLRIEQAGVWALLIAPGPVFAIWFLALRRRYTGAALVGGLSVGYFVLTGDAGTPVTLLGIVGIGALVAFGDLDQAGASGGAVEYVAAVLAVMVLAPLLVTVVPGGAASPITFAGGSGVTPAMEENIVTTDDTLEILGSIEQSPTVRFTVESAEPRYWKTGSYDRYTGDGWVRSTGEETYSDILDGPPGPTQLLRQTVEVETTLATLPAAWRPVAVDETLEDRTIVTGSGELRPEGVLEAGEQYEVVSAVPDPSPATLERAGDSYPDGIVDRYTQLPDSTPDRVEERTANIAADADTPYQVALTVEQWLRTEREYSLDIDRPDGDIADAFLFEMEAGYCTYYATTMVTMLRTQGIPARLATGYTPGERVDDDRWVVRGLNSHAWVEVYFPDVGWVSFDPTPSGPRISTETSALSEARAEGTPGTETEETRPGQGTGTEFPLDSRQIDPGIETSQPVETGPVDIETSEVSTEPREPTGDGFSLPDPPPREHLALGGIALVGLIAGLRQSRSAGRLAARVRYRLRPQSDPRADVERAHDQLLLVLERRYRPRRSDEPMRAYLDAVDAGPQVRRLAELRERARYGDGVTREEADEATRLVESIRAAGDNGTLWPR